MERIALIGTGNLAWHLAPALEKGGHVVSEIYGRSGEHATRLADRLYNATVTENLDFGESNASLFILAVSDAAIGPVASEIILPEMAAVVHTSGTVPLSLLELTASEQTGVFYPLQTFSKERAVNFQEIPLLVEASDAQLEDSLLQIGGTLSKVVKVVSSADRAALHLSAVFVNNFTNHMLSVGNLLMDKNELDFELLTPLIEETVRKALELGPVSAQTGPAFRGDEETMQQHLDQLEFNEHFKKIYELVSESIASLK